jgi:hypothetical protein
MKVGTWRSLVAHTLGVRGVGGSNPLVPILSSSPLVIMLKNEDNITNQ